MMEGVWENGVFYLGATVRLKIPPKPEPVKVVQPYDPDSPEHLNARRYFGFTDYEELDIFMLRSRYFDRRRRNAKMADYYYAILKDFL